jgi:hypothetical protein
MISCKWLPRGIGVGVVLLGLTTGLPGDEDKQAKRSPSIIGRWDMVVEGPKESYPSWLEVRKSGHHTLVGSFVGRFGSARPIGQVEFTGGSLRFAVPPQWEDRKDDLVFEGRLDGAELRGKTTDEHGQRLTWTAHRAPTLKRAHPPTWGEPIELFNGTDLSGWKPRSATAKNGWVVSEGLLVNATPGNDLQTERKFDDFKVHAEFRYSEGSNSGIYLRGRYEVQIEDNYGQEPDCEKIGGVYGFLTPSSNPAKKPGEWQTMDITLIGRTVTVIFNGERIIDRQVIPGITGGALDSKEGTPGPLMIQGDHGPIEFRKVTLTPGK